MHVGFDIVLQFLLFVQLRVEKPDGAGVSTLGSIQRKENAGEHMVGGGFRVLPGGGGHHAAVEGQLIIDHADLGVVLQIIHQAIQTRTDGTLIRVGQEKIEHIPGVPAEKLVLLQVSVRCLLDLDEQPVGPLFPEDLCDKGELADTECGDAAASAPHSRHQPLLETGHILRPGERIVICQTPQLQIVIAQQAIPSGHQEQEQQEQHDEHGADHQVGAAGSGSQPLSRIDAEQVPAVETHRLQQEGIGFPLIGKCREDALLPLHGLPHLLFGISGQVWPVIDGLWICLDDGIGRAHQKAAVGTEQVNIAAAPQHGVAGDDVPENSDMVDGGQNADNLVPRIDRNTVRADPLLGDRALKQPGNAGRPFQRQRDGLLRLWVEV